MTAFEKELERLYENMDRMAQDVWNELKAVIPSEFHGHMHNVIIHVADEPSEEILNDLPDDLREFPDELCGLHIGIPLDEASLTNPSLEPTHVYLFRYALLDQIPDDDPEAEDTLRGEIAVTILHEIGHHFGLSEEDLERLGYD